MGAHEVEVMLYRVMVAHPVFQTSLVGSHSVFASCGFDMNA